LGLTLGTGPFGQQPAGRFSAGIAQRAPMVFVEPIARRIRVRHAGVTVADSTAAVMVHEHGWLPAYYLPATDVRDAAFEPSDTPGPDSEVLGRGRYRHLRVGDALVSDAVIDWPDPPSGAPDVAGLVTFVFWAVDEWLAEDEPVLTHPRDPYHRVDVLPSTRLVEVRLDDLVIARSSRPVLVFETGWYWPRCYLPPADVRTDLLVDSNSLTRCAYKGEARYLSAVHNGHMNHDIGWVYDSPSAEVAALAGHIAFFSERIRVELDGVRLPGDGSPWAGNTPLGRYTDGDHRPPMRA
jgi:uncharacterized protein (DUF427 family)